MLRGLRQERLSVFPCKSFIFGVLDRRFGGWRSGLGLEWMQFWEGFRIRAWGFGIENWGLGFGV